MDFFAGDRLGPLAGIIDVPEGMGVGVADPELVAIQALTDTDGNLAIDLEHAYGEKNAYDFINGRNHVLKLLTLEGPYWCCATGCHLLHPILQRDGDNFGVCGEDPDGVTVTHPLTRTQVLCLLGRDKKGLCDCQGGKR